MTGTTATSSRRPAWPELKAAVAAYLKRTCGLAYEPAQVIIGCGGKHVLYEAFLAVLEPGDEAILPSPVLGVVPRDDPPGRRPRGHPPRRRRRRASRSRPSNWPPPSPPRRACWSSTRRRTRRASSTREQELAALADVVAGKEIWVFSDEIYNELVYDGVDTCSFAAVRDGPHGRRPSRSAAHRRPGP